MLLAGYETTSNALAFAIYLLAKHPNIEAKMVDEIDHLVTDQRALSLETMGDYVYVDAVCRESLRLLPSAGLFARQASQDVVIKGYLIPKGTTVVVPTFALHRHEAHWPEAALFKPERWLNRPPGLTDAAWLPFGLGPRKCIGYRFALQEMMLTLIGLYKDFHFRLQHPDRPLQLENGITASPVGGIPVLVEHRIHQKL